jgi:hypothetical protein
MLENIPYSYVVNDGGEVLYSCILKAYLWYWKLLSMVHNLLSVEYIAIIANEK